MEEEFLSSLFANTSSLDNEKKLRLFILEKIFNFLKVSTQKHAFTQPIKLANRRDGAMALLNSFF